MSLLSHQHFKVPDAMDNVQAIADEMCLLGNYPERYSKILLDTYSEAIVEDINM